MKKKILCLAAAAALLCGSLAPAPAAEAFSIGDIIGIAQGAAQYAMLDKQFKYYNDTEEGRQKLFQSYQQELGVLHDEEKEDELAGIMNRLTESIGAEDPDIYKKPYLYFICPDESFNAACSMGHVMIVNDGIFKYLTNTDEIAVVLGHEMGHGQKNHVGNAMYKKAKTNLGAAVISGALGDNALSQEVLSLAVNQIETVQISRNDEKEADKLSFDYIYRAGYNPGATAAVWQRVIEKNGDNDPTFAQEVFSPSDHPSNSERRDTYEKRLTALSKKHVTLKENTNTLEVNGKEFVTPAPAGDMSSAERKYFVMGNLAAAYDHGENKKPAEDRNGTVYLGSQAIMTPVNGDPSAQTQCEKHHPRDQNDKRRLRRIKVVGCETSRKEDQCQQKQLQQRLAPPDARPDILGVRVGAFPELGRFGEQFVDVPLLEQLFADMLCQQCAVLGRDAAGRQAHQFAHRKLVDVFF